MRDLMNSRINIRTNQAEKLEGRFPSATSNRYPSEARVDLTNYVAEVGRVIESHPPIERPKLVDDMCKMPNIADKAEALLATSVHLAKLGETEREKVMNHSIAILAVSQEESDGWHRSAQPNACKAIYHGAPSLTETQKSKLDEVCTRNPKIGTMLQDHLERQIQTHVNAVLETRHRLSKNQLSAPAELISGPLSAEKPHHDRGSRARADLLDKPPAVRGR